MKSNQTILFCALALMAAFTFLAWDAPNVQAHNAIPPQMQTETANAPTATHTMTNLNDSGAGSLRQANFNANANPGADTINFKVNGIITLTSTLVVTDSVTIDGTGQSVTISGNNLVCVMEVYTSTSVTLQTLTLTKGLGSTTNCPSGSFCGEPF